MEKRDGRQREKSDKLIFFSFCLPPCFSMLFFSPAMISVNKIKTRRFIRKSFSKSSCNPSFIFADPLGAVLGGDRVSVLRRGSAGIFLPGQLHSALRAAENIRPRLHANALLLRCASRFCEGTHDFLT